MTSRNVRPIPDFGQRTFSWDLAAFLVPLRFSLGMQTGSQNRFPFLPPRACARELLVFHRVSP